MTDGQINSSDEARLSLKSKLLIIEILVFFLPGLVISYLYYERYISFDRSQSIILGMISLVVLGGLVIIKQIFDRLMILNDIITSGNIDARQFHKMKDDTKELYEISQSFTELADKFNETNSELHERIEEIAEIKEMEVTLQRAKKEAETANAAKTRYLSKRCHDLSEPLDSMISYTNVLHASTYGPLNENQMEFVKGILEKGGHLKDLINGIVDYAKMEDEKLDLKL